MRYALAERVGNEGRFIKYFDEFIEARKDAVQRLEFAGFSIVGYHLTEVHNAPHHAELFGAKLDAHIILTISEESL